MAKENENITQPGEDGFKGDGAAGKKDGDGNPPPADAEQEKPKDKATILKEKRSLLSKLRHEDQRLEREEDAKGVICGKVATDRQERRKAIKVVEEEISLLERK